jgi:CrcB protein
MTPHDGPGPEPIDPDIDLSQRVQRRDAARGQLPVVAAVAAGGGLGAAARYGAEVLWPAGTGAFPWTTLGVNALGCAVIGVFMVLISEARTVHRLLRPFFGAGVLGGFTTFSAYAVEIERLVRDGRAAVAAAYLAATPLTALAAVWAAATATRRLTAARRAAAGRRT